jgi:hypothetical protein
MGIAADGDVHMLTVRVGTSVAPPSPVLLRRGDAPIADDIANPNVFALTYTLGERVHIEPLTGVVRKIKGVNNAPAWVVVTGAGGVRSIPYRAVRCLAAIWMFYVDLCTKPIKAPR